MGRVVISSDSELETESQKQRKEMEVDELEEEAESMETEDVEKGKKWRRKKKSGGDGMVLRWDKLLSGMALRVLLVEADDSTRQIIAALLRKCSYRVTAVSDGLKAWEILKRRSNNIDLILTEADLPSISGYALLTLIMEHNVCKSIPVIMMSSHDSVSTVYKCMLRGAADYLVKPIRRNELRNLWQHVWRRQTSLIGGIGAQDESVGQDKAEASSENNTASNHSNGDNACMNISDELAEKGSDVQSSCTKPDLEAENMHIENTHQSLQSLWGNFLLSGVEKQKQKQKQKQEIHVNCCEKLLTHEGEARAVSAGNNANAMTMDKELEPQNQRNNANVPLEACDNNEILVSSTEACDFISGCHKISSTNVKGKFNSSPHLDLSLKRYLPSDFEGQVTDGRHTLPHSNTSAFTRYTNKIIQPLFSTSAGSCYQQDAGAVSERKLSSNFSGHNSDVPGPSPITQRSDITLATRQTEESQIAACSKQRVFPIQISVKGVTSNNLCTGYDSAYHQNSCRQSGSAKLPCPSSANQPESSFRLNPFNQSNFESNSRQLSDWLGKNTNDSIDPTDEKHGYKLDSCEDRGHISPVTDQSASNSLCNGAASHFNSMGYGSTSGSNSNVDQVAVVRTSAESNSEGVFMHTTQSHRSIQREAALTKFRLKRKDRCYEKKVRYESRKKLAEQRPRVKGQFVRQMPIAASPAVTD